MKKKEIIISVICVFLLSFTVIAYEIIKLSKNDDKDVYMRIAFISSGSAFDPTTLFVLKKDGTFVISVGSSNNDNVKSEDFMVLIEEQKEFKLTTEDFKHIKELLEKVKKNPPQKKKIVWDGKMIVLQYGNKMYKANFEYSIHKSAALEELVEEISNIITIYDQ